MRETVGMGMELLEQPDVHAFRKKHDIPGRYLLYAGRIDAGKGLEELFRFFQFYKEEHPASGNLQLILIGKLGMKLPQDPAIRYIGFVDEGDKLSAMAGAVAVVQPSRLESFSIVTLEAFSVGTPVLANAHSRVLVDHCRKANAGLYYGDFEEFEEVLGLLLHDRNLGRSLGRNGQSYVKDNYGWNRLLPKYELVFRSSARPAREPRAARQRALAAAEAAAPMEESEAPPAESREMEPLEMETETDREDAFSTEAEALEPSFEEEAPEPMEGPGLEEEYAPEETLKEPAEPDYEPTGPDEDLPIVAAPPPPPPAADDEPGLPEFYRPRQRPIERSPEPGPAKEE
jgi:hypothetical protein